MGHDKKMEEALEAGVDYIRSLTDNDYFKIEVKECIKQNFLHEVTISLFERFGFKHVCFNKYDYTYFQNIWEEPFNPAENSELRIKRDVMMFAIESFLDRKMISVKLDWEDNPKLSTEISLTSTFLWVGGIFDRIAYSTPEFPYDKIKNSFLGEILKMNSFDHEFNFSEIILKTVIDFLQKSKASGDLLLFKLELEVIYQTLIKDKIPNISRKNLVSGKKLNLADKYHLAKEVFGIENTLRKLDHLSETEKHVLLSQILGCHQQAARELYNGTFYKRTQIQEDIVNPYLKRIKGD